MARSVLNALIVDSTGIVQPGTSVTVYEADGATPLIQSMYAALTGGSPLANPTVTNNIGRLVLYADTAQRVVIKPAGGTPTVAEFEPDPADLVKLTGSQVVDGKTFTTTILTNPTIASPTVTGGVFATPTINSPTINSPSVLAGTLALAALAPGSSGVLKSNGSTITAGNTVDNSNLTVPYKNIFVPGSSSAPTTTNASYDDMPDMDTGPFTTTGGKLVCTFEGLFKHSTATATESFGFSLDAATEVGERIFQCQVVNINENRYMQHVFIGVAAGSHRIKVRWKTGGATLTAATTQRSLRVEEFPLA